MDDLSTLEIINLLTVGLTSFNIRYQVANDIGTHNQYIPSHNLQSQEWLDYISKWTDNQKMIINENKTKVMIFNFNNKKQFSTRLKLKEKNLDVIEQTKLLGTIISNDLKWEENTKYLTKKPISDWKY